MTPSLVVVDSTALRSVLNEELVRKGREAGIEVEVATPAEFVSRATLRVTPCGTTVEPGVGLFVRSWPQARAGQSRNDYVKGIEVSSFLRAFAALNPLPVVNRPSSAGWAGKWTGFAALDSRAALCVSRGRRNGSVRTETYSTVVPLDSEREVQDLGSWTSFYRTDQFVPRGSYRSRRGGVGDCFETVIVAYRSAWFEKSGGARERLHLLEQSRQVAEALALDYAAVAWCIGGEDETVARIDPFWREAWDWTHAEHLSVALLGGLQDRQHAS